LDEYRLFNSPAIVERDIAEIIKIGQILLSDELIKSTKIIKSTADVIFKYDRSGVFMFDIVAGIKNVNMAATNKSNISFIMNRFSSSYKLS
jgi:hypothetical protein